jgi:hypothetical protein
MAQAKTREHLRRCHYHRREWLPWLQFLRLLRTQMFEKRLGSHLRYIRLIRINLEVLVLDRDVRSQFVVFEVRDCLKSSAWSSRRVLWRLRRSVNEQLSSYRVGALGIVGPGTVDMKNLLGCQGLRYSSEVGWKSLFVCDVRALVLLGRSLDTKVHE